jgi:uncharacterized membrane protein YsdA (DUF1294 family)/cold shock CspA family protein
MNKQDGFLASWDDVRGFGFIEPTLGGAQVFVHIKAFEGLSGRPAEGTRLSFEVETTADGKKRAKRVQVVSGVVRGRVPRRDSVPAQWGTASYFAFFAFVLVYLVVGALWRVPLWVGWLYVLASLCCFIAYKLDKSAAKAGRRRTPEDTLHFLALVGGWPGAIVAQQVLRHKSNKASFRAAFWGTVCLNVLAFVALNSPYLPKPWV